MPTLPFNDLCEGGDDYIFQKTRNLVATENDLLAVGACAANATLTSTASCPTAGVTSPQSASSAISPPHR